MTIGPLSLVLPPVLSILAAPLADGTVHVVAGFGAQLQDQVGPFLSPV